MRSFDIVLGSIHDVKLFVNATTRQDCDIDVVSGRYVVDAKSIMGIFSIDLAKPIHIEVHGTEEQAAQFYETVKQFAVPEQTQAAE